MKLPADELSVSNLTMKLQTFVVFMAIFQIVCAERGTPCITPNGENVTCIAVRACSPITSALLTENSTAIDFAKRSQCGYDTEPLVCCGSSGYPNSNFLNTTLSAGLPNRSVCGLESRENKLIIGGGNMTELYELPWMVALQYKSKRNGENAGIRCGGSLINNRYVLTAAHCIINREFQLISAWLGEWNISTDPDCQYLDDFIDFIDCADPVQKIGIEKQISHPFYSKQSGNHDIALLKLEHDVEYTEYIRPICLPSSTLPSPEFGARLIVAGWGFTENGTTSDVKLKVEVPLLPNAVCNSKLMGQFINHNQLCAGGEAIKDSCRGDSGGPLMRIYKYNDGEHRKTNQWYQEGVVSWGLGCGRAGVPAVYTRVSKYVIWITNMMSEK